MSCVKCENATAGFVLAYEKFQRGEREVINGVPTLFRCDCAEGWGVPNWAKKLPVFSEEEHTNYTLTLPVEMQQLRVKVPDAVERDDGSGDTW